MLITIMLIMMMMITTLTNNPAMMQIIQQAGILARSYYDCSILSSITCSNALSTASWNSCPPSSAVSTLLICSTSTSILVTTVSPRFHHSFTTVSPRFHHSFTTVSPQSHHSFTTVSPLFHHSFTTVSPQFHHSFLLRRSFTTLNWSGGFLLIFLTVSSPHPTDLPHSHVFHQCWCHQTQFCKHHISRQFMPS